MFKKNYIQKMGEESIMFIKKIEAFKDVKKIFLQTMKDYEEILDYGFDDLEEYLRLKGEVDELLTKKIPINIESLNVFFKEKCKALGTINDSYISLQADEVIESSAFVRLAKHFYLLHELNSEYSLFHIRLFKQLWNFLGNQYEFQVNSNSLEQLFKYGIYLSILKGDLDLPDLDIELVSRCESIKNLKNIWGINTMYTIEQDDIDLKATTRLQIQKKLDNLIERCGGIEFLDFLMNDYVRPTFDLELDRYKIHRNKTTLLKKIHKYLPVNYLILLGLKHLNAERSIEEYREKDDLHSIIIGISEDYLNVLNLVSQSLFQDVIVQINNIPKICCDNMLFEKMVIPEQYTKDIIFILIQGMFADYPNYLLERGYTFGEYNHVAKKILRSEKRIFSFTDLKKLTKVKQDVLKAILKDISCNAEMVNKNFNDIFKMTDFKYKPLIQLDNEKYFFLDANICGIGFYNVLNKIIIIDNRINETGQGNKVEAICKKLLQRKNINYKCGNYDEIKGTGYECDLIVENDTDIVFFEIKKRALDGKTEIADDVRLFSCLGEGMLAAQKQLLRHRFVLLKNSKIEMDDKQTHKINLLELNKNGKPRNITCISLGLSEYAFLTNKVYSKAITEAMAYAKLTITDKKREGELKEFNKIQKEMVELVNKYTEFMVETKKKIDENKIDIFDNTLFMTVQQFWTILEYSKNVDEFIKLCKTNIYLQEGCLDSYVQLKNVENLKRQ